MTTLRGSNRTDAAPPAMVLQAALFDMDGVVTDTADAHAAAWKRLFDEFLQERAEREGTPFEPFDIDADYRRYVDGKPRHDGVASFLAARGIELPRGDPDDDPGRETVCGLGNRKNGHFLQWLAEHRVRTYPATLALVERLRAAGVGVAVFSASRNCEDVLRNAGIDDRFDARVDGNDLARLGLAGKPDPAMLVEAARRLGAEPARTAVIEDSVAGVRAGDRGGFRPVIGVDRGDYGAALEEAGAGIVVGDPGELRLDREQGLAAKWLNAIPSARECVAELHARLGTRRPAIFLDYDGTLTPIVDDPAAADLSAAMRATLQRLAARWPVAVISGRGLEDLRARVGLENVYYAGSHGFEIAGPGFAYTAERARDYLPALDAAENELRARLADVAGHLVERKRFAIAIHYRRVAADEDVRRMEAVVNGVIAAHPGLRKSHGKKVFQVQPRLAWDKGRAVIWLLGHLGLDGDDVVPIYIGDDLTDENVFRALAGRGIALALRDGERTTAADCALDDPADVGRFLEALQAAEAATNE